jgi:hypothetical protein
MPTTPSWSEALVVGNEAYPRTVSLARGSAAWGALDLRGKHGAYLFPRVGRSGTTVLTTGVEVHIRRILTYAGAGTLGNGHPGDIVSLTGNTLVAQSTFVNADTAAITYSLNVASTASFAVNDLLIIGGGTAREEWARVGRITSGTVFGLDRPLQFAHTAAQADTVRNKADVYGPIWVLGGCGIEVIFDYSDDTTGDSVWIECRAQVYDSDLP